MKVEEIIEKDKVREVREDFYNGIMKKMARIRHLGLSFAAGIALGILVGSIHHHMHKTDRQVAMQEWLGKYNINDTKLECIEDRLFN